MTKKKRSLLSIVMALLMVISLVPMGSVAGEAFADTNEVVFDVTTIPATGVNDKDPIAEGTTFVDGFFKVVGKVTQRINDDGTMIKSLEVAKAADGAIQFTTTESSDVVLVMSSTGGANTSAVALIDEAGNAMTNQEGIGTVTATDKTTLTYTGLAAGTYRVVSPENAEYGRGARLYSITVIKAEGSAATMVEHLLDTTAQDATGIADKDPITEGTCYSDDYFKIIGSVTQRTNSDGTMKCFEVGKALGGAISFTVDGTADVTLNMSSTGGSNTSAVGLLDADNNLIANQEAITLVTGTGATAMTYTGLPAGTYRVVSPENADYARGARVISVKVSELKAASTTEYLLDTTVLDATGVTDKDAVAEGTTYADGYLKVVGKVTQRLNSDGSMKCVEVDKNLNGALAFTVLGSADVTLVVSSTGGSNTSRIGIIDANGSLVANNEAMETVSTTASTTLTYTGLTAGDYKIVSPEDAELNRGCRVISVKVVQTSSGERPARAAWDTVAAPKITDAVAADGTITVSYEMLIGYDGADKIAVTMFNKNGTELATETAASDGERGSVEFKPDASGEYSFQISAQRDGETDKSATKDGVAFVLPLVAPSISSATSTGNGGVSVVWSAVPEAEQYEVFYKVEGAADYTKAATVTTTKAEVKGLTVGTKYEFAVQAVRGSETTKVGTLTATATQDAQRVWSFAAFGSSVNKTDNFYTGSANDGSVTISSINGKGKIVPNSTDGLAFYYTTIDPETENFKLSATITVDSWTFSNGQDGFGMMAADAVGTHGDGTTFWNNSYSAVVSKVEYYWDLVNQCVAEAGEKISMKLGIGAQEKIGVTAEKIADNSVNTSDFAANIFSSTMTTLETSQGKVAGTYNLVGNCTNPPTGTLPDKALLTTFKFTIERNNTGYIVSYTDKDGNVVSQKYYDLDRNALTQIDKDNIYVGFFASRNATITVTDIVLTTSNPATDAPAEGRELTTIAPFFDIVSATATGNEEYEIIAYSNADGKVTLTTSKGEAIVTDAEMKAETYAYFKTKLDLGLTTLVATYTPDADFKPGEYEVLSSYDSFEYRYNVFRKVFEEDVIYVSPLVESSATGKGTKESPTDIYTATKYATEGQIILLDGGEYLLSSTVKVERGNDGTEQNPIYLMANPEATSRPILNFQGNCAGLVLAGDYWIFDGFDVTNSKDGQKGLQLSGSNCIVQNINAYNNGNTGIQISRYMTYDMYEDWPSNDLILNCTSYGNADKGYEDADGFAAKLTVGDGIVFDGCIAYNNADDGWDMFAKIETGSIGAVTIRNSVAYGNGFLPDGTNAGNGNGFKLGGDSMSGYHQLINCVAYDNKAKGIDSNSCPDVQVTNCTSFNNGSYNVALYTNNAANTDYSVNGLVSFRTETMEQGEQLKPKGTQDTTKLYGANNFYYDTTNQTGVNNEGATVVADWFTSLDTATTLTRNADGTINMNGLLVLTDKAAANSGAIISGTATNDYSAVVATAQQEVETAKAQAATPTPEPTKAPEPTNTPEPTKAEEKTNDSEDVEDVTAPASTNNHVVLIVVIVVICLAAVAGVVFFFLKKKGKKTE